MLTGSANLIKYLLFIFNLIFVITGIAILSVGAVIQAELAQYEDILDPNYFSTPKLLIAIGVIIFIVAFFGCCGSIKENYCMTLTFATLMIMIFILELAAGIAGYVLKDKAQDVLKTNLLNSMPMYVNGTSSWSQGEWDQLQSELHCCGVDSVTDWMTHGNFNQTFSVPISCCIGYPSNTTACNYISTSLDGIFKRGCLPVLGDEIRAHAVTLGGAGIGIAVVQMFGVILSCALAKGIKQGYETV